MPVTPEITVAKIKYFRQQATKWREVALKITEKEPSKKGEADFAYAMRKADEFDAQARELEVPLPKIAPAPEVTIEKPILRVSPDPIPPPTKRWTADRGAIPGEPMYFLDDFDNPKAVIIEQETKDGFVLFEVVGGKGEKLGIYNTLEKAGRKAEEFYPALPTAAPVPEVTKSPSNISASSHPLVLERFPYPAPDQMELGGDIGKIKIVIPPPRGAPMPPKKPKVKEEEWVYAKVGNTGVRGRKIATGTEIEQVSSSYKKDDFDKAVKIIEEKLKEVERPLIITMEGYERDWKPKGWQLLPIGPTSTWRQDWGEWEAIRDIVQNALDEAEAYTWGHDEQGLWIADAGRGVAIVDFLLGPPKLKPEYARGRYGEGMKIAALALLRDGYSVHVSTVGREIWMVFIERVLDTTPTHQLAALYKSNGSRQGTRFDIIGYAGDDYTDRFAVNLPKSSILWEAPSIITKPKQRFNQLIQHPFHGDPSSRIFARDIYMRDIDSDYSYNLWGFTMAPDRHAPEDESEVWTDIGRLWCTVNKVDLLESFLKMVKDPPIVESEESRQVNMSSYDMGVEPTSKRDYANFISDNGEVWRKAWANVMGENAVIRTNEKWDNIIKHLGYQSVGLYHGVRETLSRVIINDLTIKQESQERLKETETIPDARLDKQQMAHLKLARAIVREVMPFSPPSGVYAAIIPPASDRVRTAGMYGTTTQAVYLSLDILYRGRSTIDTLVHELAHHRQFRRSGEAEDLTPTHAEAMTEMAAEVVRAAATGDLAFRELLKEVSW